MSDLRLTLFGAPKLERDGQPIQLDTRKSMALLVYLAMNGQEQSRETLSALLWPEQRRTPRPRQPAPGALLPAPDAGF